MYAVAEKRVTNLKGWCQFFKYFAVISITVGLFSGESHYVQVSFSLLALTSMWAAHQWGNHIYRIERCINDLQNNTKEESREYLEESLNYALSTGNLRVFLP